MANGGSRFERAITSLLASTVVVLAIVVGVLVWRLLALAPVVEPTPPVDLDAVAEAVSERLTEDGFLQEEPFGERVDAAHAALADGHRVLADQHREMADAISRLRTCCEGNAASILRQFVPVTFENGRLRYEDAAERRNETREDALARLTPNSRGVALTPAQEAELAEYAAAFKACAASAPVRLKVQGYSSTREFADAQGAAHIHSDALNVKLANLRAQMVIDYLDGQDANAENGVHVLHEPWPDYRAMRRPFQDAGADLPGSAQERLNRVVLVEIQDAGGCATNGDPR